MKDTVRTEIDRIKKRIAKADRRLSRGVDERREVRGVVRESDIKARLQMKLDALQQESN